MRPLPKPGVVVAHLFENCAMLTLNEDRNGMLPQNVPHHLRTLSKIENLLVDLDCGKQNTQKLADENALPVKAFGQELCKPLHM